jgi:hypothetical protein
MTVGMLHLLTSIYLRTVDEKDDRSYTNSATKPVFLVGKKYSIPSPIPQPFTVLFTRVVRYTSVCKVHQMNITSGMGRTQTLYVATAIKWRLLVEMDAPEFYVVIYLGHQPEVQDGQATIGRPN